MIFFIIRQTPPWSHFPSSPHEGRFPNEEARSINLNIGQPRYFRFSARHGRGAGLLPEIFPWFLFFTKVCYVYNIYTVCIWYRNVFLKLCFLLYTSLLLNRYMIQNMLTVKSVSFKVLRSLLLLQVISLSDWQNCLHFKW